MDERFQQVKRDFFQSMGEVYGLSKNYADAAWLSVKDNNTSDGVIMARSYCRRFGIAPVRKQTKLF